MSVNLDAPSLKPTKIYLISPREPSGATWLINCFLEIGIKTYRETLGEMWMRAASGGYKLNPVEKHLKKWLPMLSRQEVFHFRPDVEVEWAHHWPQRQHDGHRIVYFVRDPRDALFSRYRRESPDLSFQEFLDFPDTRTLLDKTTNWCLFNEAWLSQRDIRVFRFEDYKQDARRTLEDVLGYLGLRVDEAALLGAIEASTFEKAAEAEKKYREENPEDVQLINRASQVGSWRASDDAACIAGISDKAAELLAQFGQEGKPGEAGHNYLPQAEVLRFFSRISVDDAFWRSLRARPHAQSKAVEQVRRLHEFMRGLDDVMLQRSGLSPYEIYTLLGSLAEFAVAYPGADTSHLNWPHQHRLAQLWWRLSDFIRAQGLRLPTSLRWSYWRLRSQFKNKLLRT